MGSNRFYISLVLNCLFIFAAAFLCFFFLQVRQQPNTAIGIAIVALLLTFRLIYHVNRTNRILGNFLSHMQEKDPTLHHSASFVDKNFRGLNEALDTLIREFKENRIDLEVQAQYLETILDNVSTGILCFGHRGQVTTLNKSAAELLDIRSIQYVAELDQLHAGLGTKILGMKPEEQQTETIKRSEGMVQLSLHCTQIKLKQDLIQIVALNDITHQMEEQEILSWKKLIRVINHEIMNSMTPIITLAMATRKKLASREAVKAKEELSSEDLEDAIQSASIIEERSKGLVAFIERYKKLTGLPPMKMERFAVRDLFVKVEKLFREELQAQGIKLRLPDQCPVVMEADRQMMEQVLINLLKNSLEAVRNSKEPEIDLACRQEAGGRLYLQVSDNGEGILPDKLDQVFVPFFTTRENGSGIGLSLCKQIIRSHQGHLQIESSPGRGTSVTITL
jgi:nitrogen fixation/metabolism regulation signal transduction histidine kinase